MIGLRSYQDITTPEEIEEEYLYDNICDELEEEYDGEESLSKEVLHSEARRRLREMKEEE